MAAKRDVTCSHVRKGQTARNSVFFTLPNRICTCGEPHWMCETEICVLASSQRQERPSYDGRLGSIQGRGKEVDQICWTPDTKDVPVTASLLTGENIYGARSEHALKREIVHLIQKTFHKIALRSYCKPMKTLTRNRAKSG